MIWDAEERGVLRPGVEIVRADERQHGHRPGLRGRGTGATA